MTPRAILTAAETRAAEDASVAAGTSVQTLMARAGEGVARLVAERWAGAEILVACGPGNNGGDGYVAARVLAAGGARVRVAALAEPATLAAAEARAAWTGLVELFAPEIADGDVLVDALFGTGLSRPLEDGTGATLGGLGSAARVAVDLPSGVETDTGALLGIVAPFTLTVALGALKRAHRLLPAAALCGEIALVDIGLEKLPDALVEIAPPRLVAPGHDATKYRRGKVTVVAGAMGGAALLAATAAQRAGAGYVELLGLAGQGEPHALVRRAWDLSALDDERTGALVCGPGLGRDDEPRRRLDAALASAHPLVLDADALTLLGRNAARRIAARDAPTLLTPHDGEFARMFGAIGGDRIAAARRAAGATGATMLLKGAATIVAAPDGRAAINPVAPPWLASAGTGDVLAGLCGALIAGGSAAYPAAQAAAWLHAEAARRAGPYLIADDLVRELPMVCASRL